MKNLLIIYLALVTYTTYSQDKFRLYTELNQGDYFHWNGGSQYLESGFQLGGLFNTQKGSYTVYGIYRFGGHRYNSPKSKAHHLVPYELHYSSIGIGVGYRILNLEKKISPFIRIEALTEVRSQNKLSNFYMNDSSRPTHSSNFNSYPKYSATIFIGNLYSGVDWNVIRNFNINLGVGFGVRGIKVGYDWITPSYHTRWIMGMNLQLGFSYSFSFKKKE